MLWHRSWGGHRPSLPDYVDNFALTTRSSRAPEAMSLYGVLPDLGELNLKVLLVGAHSEVGGGRDRLGAAQAESARQEAAGCRPPRTRRSDQRAA